ncbi:MAG: helix-turn-helix transcriptional regulator [Deltaproteobacteria bacterium]|nr:helix-turn-helix transcriptional regulator [Deltaproteobacteria bacterium]
MQGHMKARTTEEYAEFTIRVPRDIGYPVSKMLRGFLESLGLEQLTNEEGEEVYEHERPENAPAVHLRGLRTREGITQQQLADALGITQTRVAEFETGTRRISINMAKRIGKTYGVTYKAFL